MMLGKKLSQLGRSHAELQVEGRNHDEAEGLRRPPHDPSHKLSQYCMLKTQVSSHLLNRSGEQPCHCVVVTVLVLQPLDSSYSRSHSVEGMLTILKV